jgi:hypothetical protein
MRVAALSKWQHAHTELDGALFCAYSFTFVNIKKSDETNQHNFH